MVAALDLTGKKFGRLTARRFDEEKSAEKGRRHWLCDCRCGGTTSVEAGCLVSGNTRSCGCLLKEHFKKKVAFKKGEVSEAYRAKERINHSGEDYLSPRKSMHFLKVSKPTLSKWGRWKKRGNQAQGCPWLGRAIKTLPQKSAFEREITYYLEKDLIRIREARCDVTQFPEYEGLTSLVDAQQRLGFRHHFTIRKHAKDARPLVRLVTKPAKTSDGRSVRRTYVPTRFVDELELKLNGNCVPAADMTTTEAACELRRSKTTIRQYVRDGILTGSISKKNVQPVRANGTLLGQFAREVMLINRESVERLRRQLRGELPIEVKSGAPPIEVKPETLPILAKAKRDPGRPAGLRAGIHAGILAAWDSGRYGGNISALAADFKQDRTTVSKILKKAGRTSVK